MSWWESLRTVLTPPSRRAPAEPPGPPWWERVTCQCAGQPERHDVALIGAAGVRLAFATVAADEAHRWAARIKDRKFGVSCGEFVVSPTLELQADEQRVISVDVRRVTLVDIDREGSE